MYENMTLRIFCVFNVMAYRLTMFDNTLVTVTVCKFWGYRYM